MKHLWTAEDDEQSQEIRKETSSTRSKIYTKTNKLNKISPYINKTNYQLVSYSRC
uniref:Uncharacterized protein n=1 Tax=Arion vulgaris TaxID=1028688 RepID=A0A0B6ZPQ6_9EUPU